MSHPFEVVLYKKILSASTLRFIANQRVFVAYRNGKCTKQFVRIRKNYTKKIAIFFNLKEPEKYTDHRFKRSAATFVVAEQYLEKSISKKIKISKQFFNSTESASTSTYYNIKKLQ